MQSHELDVQQSSLGCGKSSEGDRCTSPFSTTLEQRLSSEKFSSAAEHYDRYAELQRNTSDHLLGLATRRKSDCGVVVDLGCGTGYGTGGLSRVFGSESVLSIDRAPGMAAVAKRSGARHVAIGDAARIPVADNRCGLVFSNLALHWCEPMRPALSECRRILEPGGWLCMSVPGPETLQELRHAWQCIDQAEHVHRFPSVKEICADVESLNLSIVHCEVVDYRVYHTDMGSLLGSLQGIGAGNVSRMRRRGLMGRSALDRLGHAYPGRKSDGSLSATWEICFFGIQKPF